MKSKELTPDDWLDEIAKGLRYRKEHGREECWFDLEQIFNHEMQQGDNPGPNIIASNVDSLLASLNVNDPYITVKPTRSDQLEKAPMVESVANRLMQQAQLQQEVDVAIVCSFLWGRGFVKNGYDSEFGFDPRFDLGLDEPMGLTLTQYDDKGRRIETLPTEPGMPWVRSVLPQDIVVPWGCRELDDAPWVAHRVVRHIDAIMMDPKYENKGKLQGRISQEDFAKSYETVLNLYRFTKDSQPRMEVPQARKAKPEFVELWEIHDRRTNRLMVVVTDHEKFLRNETDLLQFNGRLPFTSLCFTPRVRNFWVTPDAYYLKFHQFELTEIAIQNTKHRRIQVAKIIMSEDAFDMVEAEKLCSPTVGAVVRKKGEIPMSEAVMTLNHQIPNFSLFQEAEAVRRNARETIGFSRNQMGEFEATGRRTATEANIVDQAANLRMDRRQRAVSTLYRETMRNVLNSIFAFWQIPKIVEIIGDDGARKWKTVTGPEMQGQYDYSMGFSPSGATETIQTRRQMALQFYMMAAQDPLVDPIELRRYVANAMNDPRFTKIFRQGVLDGQPPQIPQGPPGQAGFGGLSVGGAGAGQAPLGAG